MERKIFRKKLLAILMIISLIAADFFVLSSNLLTYADEVSSDTNNPNVEFSVYFKNSAGQQNPNVLESIKNENLKLFAKIKILTGYLNEGSLIEIEKSNFKLKNTTSSQHISSINGNKITLKQIDEGETEIPLDIEPIIGDKLDVNMLSQTSKIKLNGSYTGEKSSGIQYGKEVSISFTPDQTAKAELETKIVTNKILPYGTTTKRVVQLLIESKLKDNQYPIETSTLTVNVPGLDKKEPEVTVLAIGELATNGQTIISSKDITNKDGELKINLNNTPSTKNEIIWKKKCSDKLLVTYIYDANTNMTNFELTANSEIKVFNSATTYKETSSPETYNEDSNNSIIAIPEITTNEIYKGQLYANINATEKLDVQYETKTTLVITNPNISQETTINEGADKFILNDNSKVGATTKYISTEINKDKVLDIIGDYGSLEITNGTIATTINKAYFENNGNENIVLTYGEDATNQLQIKVIQPQKAGVLELKHIKVITGSYTKNQIRTIKKINTTASVNGTSTEKNPKEASIEIQETISKAELYIDKNATLSSETTKDINMGVTFIANSEKYDLYSNPTIRIELPEVVEGIQFNTIPVLQNVNEKDSITIKSYNAENNIITIELNGNQTIYPNAEMSQLYIPLDLKVTVSKLSPTQMGNTVMIYENDNAIKYYGETTEYGICEQTINIQAPTGLIQWFNSSLEDNVSRVDNITHKITQDDAGKKFNLEVTILNNKSTDINNVRILGKLAKDIPLISGINGENVYYTENKNATYNLEDKSNGWTNEFTDQTALYLIKLDTLEQGNHYSNTINLEIKNPITDSLTSTLDYQVIYDTELETNKVESSREISLETYEGYDLGFEFYAQMGQEKISNGDNVKQGEVIKYISTITNNSSNKIENIELKLEVPEGTVLVEPTQNVYLLNEYYREITEEAEIAKLTSAKIQTLNASETFTLEYFVRVKSDVAGGTEILNNATLSIDGLNKETKQIKNIVNEANIRATLKKAIDEEIRLTSGTNVEYDLIIDNLTNSTINIEDLGVEIVSDEISLESKEISANTISANESVTIKLKGKIKDDAQQMIISVVVTDANNRYRTNSITETLIPTDATITLETPQNDKTLKEGDEVIYNISVQNIGTTSQYFKVYYSIPEELSVQSISVNGNIIKQASENAVINNVIYEGINLNSQEQGQVVIKAKVKHIEEAKVIRNTANVEVLNVCKDISTEISHTLTPTISQEEEVKNIIAGIIWLDTNKDGKKDENEAGIRNVKIKLYNKTTQNYLQLGENNQTNIVSNGNGEYVLSNISDGSYIVVFEYDTEKYEFTTYQANGVDTSKNSKVQYKEIVVNGENVTVSGAEINILQENITNINMGLVEKPKQNENETPGTNPPEVQQPDKKQISGYAWLDTNRNGQKDEKETPLANIKVKIYDVINNNYLKNQDGSLKEVVTDSNGKYILYNIEKGTYILVFGYDTEKYELTTYQANGVDTNKNSKVIVKKVSLDGKEMMLAITDTIKVEENVSNINIGLKEKLIFDLELNKYISKIVVQNNKQTKVYEYNNSTFEKVEINKKQIQGSLVILEYTINVKNKGEIAGYAKNIVDYLPNGLTFSSELNTDWYLSNQYLYTKTLENTEIKPGEEHQIKLILTKTMSVDNVGLINNRAEIYQDYNMFGENDINSTPNNQVQNENDLGTTDIIIGVSTGISTIFYTILIIANILLLGFAIVLMIRNGIIKIPTKEERR